MNQKSKGKSIAALVEDRNFQRIISSPFVFPFLLLLIGVLAFAFFIPKLGFYWDDWPIIFITQQGDISFMQSYLQYDRPLLILPYRVATSLLGVDPQNWHVLALILRLCTGLSVWLLMRQVWPNRKFLAEQVALLFLVYPSFTEQSISVTYLPHFLAQTMLFLSIGFSVTAIQQPGKHLPFTILAIALGAYNLFTVEYFAGLELIRFIFIFLVVGLDKKTTMHRWRKSLWHWTPYFLLILSFAVWRIFFANVTEDPNQLSLVTSFAAAPTSTAISFLEGVARGFLYILVSVWNNALKPELIDLSDKSTLFTWGIGILAALCTMIFFSYSRQQSKNQYQEPRDEWGPQIIGFGALAFFFGMIPVYLIQKDLFSGLFADRLSLPAIFGASVLWVGLVKFLLKPGFYRGAVIAILIGLAVGVQLRASHLFALDWEKQTRVYWQLFWRSESLEPETSLVFSGALSGYVSEYAASAAINALYDSSIETGRVNYWVFDYFDHFEVNEEIVNTSDQITARFRNFNFHGPAKQAVFLHYSSGGQCLWVLNSLDENNSDVPSGFREIGSGADLSSLTLSQGDVQFPSLAIFGEEPAHDWCYYFEKIDQARQTTNWPLVLALWAESQEKGLRTNNQFELVPVLLALQSKSSWNEALELSKDMVIRQLNVRSLICSIWPEISLADSENSIQRALDEFLQDANC